jgi:SPP1 gp7 family putative phage head morphogenesis protein
MTVNEAINENKAQEIDEDKAYTLLILEEEKKAEEKIKALIAVWWTSKKDRRKFYKSMSDTIEELFELIEEDFAVEFLRRYKSGYLYSAYIAQMLKHSLDKANVPDSYNINWHLGGASYLDDLTYYKNRLLDSIKRELERKVILDAPASEAVSSTKKPFKTLENSTKALVDTECVYAERQGAKDAYVEYDASKYRFIATLDTLTCPVCGTLDGKAFDLDKVEVGINYPPIHLHCRCTTIPYFGDFATSKRVARDEHAENIEVSMTYEEWKEKYGLQK